MGDTRINNKFQNSQLEREKEKTTSGIAKVNVIWAISILVAFIIFLVAYILCNRVVEADKIINYISNASLLLSIVLSIFAIQYTYYSNIQIQSQFEKINSAASHIEGTSVELSHINRKLDESIEEILQKLGTMDTKMDNLSTNNKIDAHSVSNL